jgi:hypothetical protein
MKTMVWNVTHAKHVSLHGKKKNITNTFFLLFTKGLRLFHTIRWEKKNIYIYIYIYIYYKGFNVDCKRDNGLRYVYLYVFMYMPWKWVF